MNTASTTGSSSHSIFQLKISLKNVSPPIWRRFQVSGNVSLYKLHKIIQILMDWGDYHLFEFKISNVPFGIPDDDCTYELKDARRFKLNKVLQEEKKFLYAYDFGDGWENELMVEKIIPSETELKHAVCLKGRRSAPPEDCGGPWGYSDLLDILKTPRVENEDEEIKEKRDWIGDDFDPEYFNLEEINQMLKSIR